MSELYMMVTITNRNRLPGFVSFYQSNQVPVMLISLASGTANSEMLDYFGLEAHEKCICFSVVTDSVWSAVKKGLQREMQIDVPNTGIAFTIPMSSIGGKRELLFLTENQGYEKGDEATLKDTTHELLVVIADLGHSDMIMDAARQAGAAGGTIIHAKGTGMERAEKFLGVTLASEKEVIFIVAKTSLKNAIMQSVMEHAGMNTKAKAIVFSLPVTSTAGLRLLEAE